MVCIEDSRLEKSVIAGVSCIAVPVEAFVPVNGEPVITTYSLCREKAEEWEERFGDELLCENALDWLEGEIKSIAEMLGYARMNSENEFMFEYIFAPGMQMPNYTSDVKIHKISSNAVLSELCANSGCDIEIADDGEDILFAVVENGRLCAYAGMNDVPYDDGSVEISVETASECRRRGFGVACVTALLGYLLDKGKTVRYKCARENVASSALCEKCGFMLEGTRFSLVYERK